MVRNNYNQLVRQVKWARVGKRLIRVGTRVGGRVLGPIGAAYSALSTAKWAADKLGQARRVHKWITGSASKSNGSQHKKVKLSGSIITRHNDMTVHKLGMVKVPGAAKLIKNASRGKFAYRNMNQVIIGGFGSIGQGRQANGYPECIMTRPMLIGDISNARNDKDRLPDDIFKLNPYSARPVNDIYVTAPPASGVDAADVIGLRNVVSQLGILSMTTVPQVVDVYWLTPRYDTNDDPNATWYSAIDAYRLGQNLSTNSALPSILTADPGVAAVDNWGDNPFKYTNFRNNWISLKHQRIVMQPGDQRMISLNIVFNKVFSRKTFEEIRESKYLKGITVIPFLIAKAGLVGIKENEATPNATEVSYGSPKIGIVHNSFYNFCGLEVNRFKTSRVYKGIIEATSGVQQEIDDEDKVDKVEEN